MRQSVARADADVCEAIDFANTMRGAMLLDRAAEVQYQEENRLVFLRAGGVLSRRIFRSPFLPV